MKKSNLSSRVVPSVASTEKDFFPENSVIKTEVQALNSHDEKTQGGIPLHLLKSGELNFLKMLEKICFYRIKDRLMTVNGDIKDYKKWNKFKHNPDSFIKSELGVYCKIKVQTCAKNLYRV